MYWTDVHEDLLVQYVSGYTNPDVRSKVYAQIRPALLKMIREVLFTYFSGSFKDYQVDDIITECEIHIYLNTIHKFKIDNKTKGYSFLGTSIKHNLMDEVIRAQNTKKIIEFESFYENNEDGERFLDVPDYQEEENTKVSVLEALYEKKEMLNKYNGQQTKRMELINATINIFEENDLEILSKKYFAYLLMKKTGYGLNVLVKTMDGIGLGRMMNRKLNLGKYEEIKKRMGFVKDEDLGSYLYKKTIDEEIESKIKDCKATTGFQYKIQERKNKPENPSIFDSMGQTVRAGFRPKKDKITLKEKQND